MKSSYEVRARRFINQIFNYIADCQDIDAFYNAVDAFNHDFHRKVICSNGINRMVLITSDYVVKMDRPDSEDYGNCFGNCETEYKFYINHVEGTKFEQYFARCTRYELNGIFFYIMPRVYGVGMKDGHAYDYIDDPTAYEFISFSCSDLHSDNFGFKHKHVVIIDYAAN